MKVIVNTPCEDCPKKMKYWSNWGICETWIKWANEETAKMNQELEVTEKELEQQ